MADVKVTVRNLIDSDLGTPLRKFTGILDSKPTEDKQYGDASKGEKVRTTTYVHLNFKDVEPIDTTEPYNFPTATITLGLSNRTKSKYGIFGKSTADILDMQYSKEQLTPGSPQYIKPDARADIDTCIGKRMGLVMADGIDGRPTPPKLFDGRANEGKGGDVDTPTWMCYQIEGIGVAGNAGVSPNEQAYKLLDGRTSQQFKQTAVTDPVIRADAGLLAMISMPDSAPSNFAAVAVKAGAFTVGADGVYHRVAK